MFGGGGEMSVRAGKLRAQEGIRFRAGCRSQRGGEKPEVKASLRVAIGVIQEKPAVRGKTRRELAHAVRIQKFLAPGAVRFFAVEVEPSLAAGIENNSPAIGRPDRVELRRRIEGKTGAQA